MNKTNYKKIDKLFEYKDLKGFLETHKYIDIVNGSIDLSRDFIEISSAVGLNNFNKDILFTLKNKTGLYIGKKEFYQTLGIYDNSSGTLIKISDNEHLLSLLNGHFSHIALAGLLVSGEFQIEEIFEFYEICRYLNMKFYDCMSEKDNKDMYRFNELNRKRREKNETKWIKWSRQTYRRN